MSLTENNSKNLGPISRKILKKIYGRAMQVDELFKGLGLNDFTLNRYLRLLIIDRWIEKDDAGNYRICPSQKENIIKILRNKTANKYAIHKILGDSVEIASEEKNSIILDFHELELTGLNQKILESKIKDLQDFISKMKLIHKNDGEPVKTYYTFHGIVSENTISDHVNQMYQARI